MTNEMKRMTQRINAEVIKYFFIDNDLETIFVAGPMLDDNYEENIKNEYNIGIICKKIEGEKIIKFDKFLKELCKKITTENIEVIKINLLEPTNYKLINNKKNIILNAMIYTKELMDRNLPKATKYQFGNKYKIIYGKDNLKKYKKEIYDLNNLVYDYEGIKYCLDMLKNKEKEDYIWSIKNNKCELIKEKVIIDDDNIIENCCNTFNKFIDNLINYCKMENLDIPENKVIFTIRLLGNKKTNENTLFLLQGLFLNNEIILKSLFQDPVHEIIKLLEEIKYYVNYIDSTFSKKREITKKLIKL